MRSIRRCTLAAALGLIPPVVSGERPEPNAAELEETCDGGAGEKQRDQMLSWPAAGS